MERAWACGEKRSDGEDAAADVAVMNGIWTSVVAETAERPEGESMGLVNGWRLENGRG